jgi:hypothetical protein
MKQMLRRVPTDERKEELAAECHILDNSRISTAFYAFLERTRHPARRRNPASLSPSTLTYSNDASRIALC